MALAGCYGLVRAWSCWGSPERAAGLPDPSWLHLLGWSNYRFGWRACST